MNGSYERALRKKEWHAACSRCEQMSDFFSALAPLHAALDYHLERHSVLSSNVAHVDTPGYKPSDLARVEDVNFNSVFGVELAKTQAGHMPGAQGAELRKNGDARRPEARPRPALGAVTRPAKAAKVAPFHCY